MTNIDPLLVVPVEERPDQTKAHLIMRTLTVFEGGKKQTQEFHGMFNSTYFIENSVIVMDNAKVPLGTPNSIWKKQEVANYCL